MLPSYSSPASHTHLCICELLSVSIRCGKLQPPVISFNDVAFSYSGKKQDYLFSGLHFGIDSDSRIALVGPNGAGKSTLLKVRISLGGKNVE